MDAINPEHYKRSDHPSGVECIIITEQLSFCLGNVVKYIYRAEHKGTPGQDLRKAAWYARREAASHPVRLPVPLEVKNIARVWGSAQHLKQHEYMLCRLLYARRSDQPELLLRLADECG
jgi:Protein of unknwon function (DUF3310)